MRLAIVSFDGHNIQDANYASFFPEGSVMLQAEGQAGLVEREFYSPVFTYKGRSPLTLPIHIKMLGTIATQIDELKSWFYTFDQDEGKLLVADANDSNKQWYVMATPISQPRVEGSLAIFNLLVADPIWREQTESTDSWSVTASGQTKAITNGGNMDARPTFEITPTAAKTSGTIRYRSFVTVYNQTSRTFAKYPLDLGEDAWDTAALVADASNYVLINDGDGITDEDTTIAYDGEVGTFPASGLAYLGTEQISYTSIAGGEITGVVRGVNGTSAAAHADDLEIYASKMDADGGDIHVFIDGREVDYWLDGINTATTKLWVNIDLLPKQELTLDGAHNDSVTTISVENTSGNRAALEAMPPTGIILINSELMTYTAKSVGGLSFTVKRGCYDSTAAAHSDTDAIRWIEHPIWIVYGDESLSDFSVDDTRKPVFALASSTNTSWDFDSFKVNTANSGASTRTAQWADAAVEVYEKNVTAFGAWSYYTSLTSVDPETQETHSGVTFTVMGICIQYISGTSAGAANGYCTWSFYHPAGVTHITTSGYKKAKSTSYWFDDGPDYDVSNDGVGWTNVFTVAVPGSAQTNTAWSEGPTALGATYLYHRFYAQQENAGTLTLYTEFDVDDLTWTLDSTAIPAVAMSAETQPYLIDAVLTNNTTTEYITINYAIPVDDTLIINTDDKTITHDDWGVSARSGLTISSIRYDWLRMQAGANTFQWDETGAAGLTIALAWEDRKV